MTARPAGPVRTGGATATTRCPRAPGRSMSRWPHSPRGICASSATAAARSGWSTRCTCRNAILPISDILARARHDGGGGRAGKAELLTGIAAASSRPVRRIGVVLGVGGVLVWVRDHLRDHYCRC